MRLPDTAIAHIVDVLGADADDDVAAVTLVLETLCNHVRAADARIVGLDFDICGGAEHDVDRYTLSLRSLVDVFTDAFVRVVFNASLAVLDVRFDARSGAIDIVMARASAAVVPTRAEAMAPDKTKRRHVPFDYDAASRRAEARPAPGDRAVIEGIVDDVYNAVRRVPSAMACWYECVHDAATPAPKASVGDETASASEDTEAGAVVGYSLCFKNVPAFSATLLEHLATAYSGAYVCAFLWLAAPRAHVAESPVLVVNVRAAAPAARLPSARALLKKYVPRGAGEATFDAAATTASSGARANKRARRA
jgi:hypothetical protein